MTSLAPAPFGRGATAPLAGRTILQIVPPSSAGGDEGSTLAVAAALVEAGARALVACESHDLASELQAVGGLHIPFPSATKNPLAMTLNARRLARILETEGVDLVHARSRAASWVALGACRSQKRALITSVQADRAGAPRTSLDRAVADGDLVIAPSQAAAERAAKLFPEALNRLRIVRPGLDLLRLSPNSVSRERVAAVRQSWGVAPHERVVLAPARLIPSLGQRLLIEAAGLIGARGHGDLRFVLAGAPPKPSVVRELDALASGRGIKTSLTRSGALSDRPAAFLAAAAIVFPATEAQGVSRAVLEAAAMGALIIVSDIGAAREFIAAPPYSGPEERAGWLVPPDDAAALASAIEEALILGASERERIRRRARARVAERHARQRMTGDTLRVYAEALEL